VSQLKYFQLINLLLYISNRTRPDISNAMGRLSSYTNNPSREHLTALKRVFQISYRHYWLLLDLHWISWCHKGYSYANWVTDSHDVKSTTGYVFMFGDVVVSWKFYKQIVIAKSTIESELITLDTTCSETEWLKW